jgi:ectoine hydroxylase-related dioxygenase (phytanoyl-CoA dioxygenase family)
MTRASNSANFSGNTEEESVLVGCSTSMPDGLQRFGVDTAIGELSDAIRADGGIVVRGLLSRVEVEQLDAQLDPFVARRQPGFHHDDSDTAFYGGNTKRIQGLAAKSDVFVQSVLLNNILLSIADELLLPNCGDYWMSQAETIFIGPGNKAQVLHRDDVNWSQAASIGIDLQVSALIALGDYDAEVGATIVIPRSHLTHGQTDNSYNPSMAQPVELEPGDALIYLGSLVHGGGANVTADRVRKALYIGFLLGWLTPEEAVPQSITEDVASRLPARARELLGWANIHGNAASEGVHAAVQLWQLDRDDLERFDGLFIDR